MPRVRIATNKQDGSLWAEQPNGELIPITPEQADIIRNKPVFVDNFLSSAGAQKIGIIQDTRDGSLYAELPGGVLRSVTEEQAKIIEQDSGFFENFIRSAGGTVEQLLLGAGQLLPGAEDYSARIEAVRQAQQAREMISPWAAGLGEAFVSPLLNDAEGFIFWIVVLLCITVLFINILVKQWLNSE